MGRLQEFMSRMENGDDDDDRLSDLAAQEELLNRQKQTDLMRAQARSVVRPIKKEKRCQETLFSPFFFVSLPYKTNNSHNLWEKVKKVAKE